MTEVTKDVSELQEHGVLRVIADRVAAGSRPTERADGCRVVLAIEGGANRGVIAGGMAAAVEEAGLLPAFDAVYGSSSGALTSAWLLSSGIASGLQAWTDPSLYSRAVRLSNLLRRKPLFDLRWLIEEFYDETLQLNADRILANPITFHPLATDATTGASVDLAPFVHDKATLHTAMRASSAVPILTGTPVPIGGAKYVDAGVAESIPLDTPIEAGATHILVLSSRKRSEQSNDSPAMRWVTQQWLQRTAPGAVAPFLERNSRGGVVAARLDDHNADFASSPSVLTVRPAADAPDVSRLETDPAVMQAGASAGADALRHALATILA